MNNNDTIERTAPVTHQPTRAAENTVDRWEAHPWWARAVRISIFLVPVVVSFVFALWLSSTLPLVDPFWLSVARWVLIAALSTLVLLLMQRVAKRFTPLAGLLALTMVFPDAAPSRFGVALRTGTTAQLKSRLTSVGTAGLGDTPADAATTVLELVAALSKHDRLTRGHSERVRAYSRMIGDELGLEAAEIDRLHWAGLLHDVGKIVVPSEILNKDGRLTAEEFAIVKSHTTHGQRIVAPLESWLGEETRAVWEHHERWDGRGYPAGLKADETALASRIVAVADAFDVMTSARSYKAPMSAREARLELTRCSGSQFDPTVVRAMMSISLGALWAAMGPLSLISQIRLFPRRLTQGGSTVAAVLAALLASVISVAAAGLPGARDRGAQESAVEVVMPDASAITATQPSAIDDPTVATVDVIADSVASESNPTVVEGTTDDAADSAAATVVANSENEPAAAPALDRETADSAGTPVADAPSVPLQPTPRAPAVEAPARSEPPPAATRPPATATPAPATPVAPVAPVAPETSLPAENMTDTDPVVADPVAADPVVTDPVAADPVVADPVVTDPVVTDPVVTDPVVADPVVADPVVTDPVVVDPVVTDAAAADADTNAEVDAAAEVVGQTPLSPIVGDAPADTDAEPGPAAPVVAMVDGEPDDPATEPVVDAPDGVQVDVDIEGEADGDVPIVAPADDAVADETQPEADQGLDAGAELDVAGAELDVEVAPGEPSDGLPDDVVDFVDFVDFVEVDEVTPPTVDGASDPLDAPDQAVAAEEPQPEPTPEPAPAPVPPTVDENAAVEPVDEPVGPAPAPAGGEGDAAVKDEKVKSNNGQNGEKSNNRDGDKDPNQDADKVKSNNGNADKKSP